MRPGSPAEQSDKLDLPTKSIIAVQEVRFPGHVLLDGFFDAGIEKLRLGRRVEKAIEVRRVIENPDIAVLGWLPFNQGQQAVGVTPQGQAICADLFQNGGGNRKDDAGRTEMLFRQHMVDQVAVQSAVAVFEWVDIDKSERQQGRGEDGIEGGTVLPVKGDHSLNQGG